MDCTFSIYSPHYIFIEWSVAIFEYVVSRFVPVFVLPKQTIEPAVPYSTSTSLLYPEDSPGMTARSVASLDSSCSSAPRASCRVVFWGSLVKMMMMLAAAGGGGGGRLGRSGRRWRFWWWKGQVLKCELFQSFRQVPASGPEPIQVNGCVHCCPDRPGGRVVTDRERKRVEPAHQCAGLCRASVSPSVRALASGKSGASRCSH